MLFYSFQDINLHVVGMSVRVLSSEAYNSFLQLCARLLASVRALECSCVHAY